jgi:hypothetical protein
LMQKKMSKGEPDRLVRGREQVGRGFNRALKPSGAWQRPRAEKVDVDQIKLPSTPNRRENSPDASSVVVVVVVTLARHAFILWPLQSPLYGFLTLAF